MNRSMSFVCCFVLCSLLYISMSQLHAQQIFEAHLDGADTLTQIPDQTGRNLKFLATDTRLVVLDFENYRILFYQRGTSFTDNAIIKIVGVHSLVQDNIPFDPAVHNRLNSEFSGAIWNGRLYVANVTYGEILRFDLDGNYVDSRPGKYRVLLSDAEHLFAFAHDSIYVHNETTDIFEFRALIPAAVAISADRDAANVRAGANRLTVRKDTTLSVYNLTDVLAGASPSPLFTVHSKPMPEAEIVGSQILWATSYAGQYGTCDLDGNNSTTGQFDTRTQKYIYSGQTLFIVGVWNLVMADSSLGVISSTDRHSLYLQLNLLGADSTNLYFYDGRVGRELVAPLDPLNGQYHVSTSNEFGYSGWLTKLRNGLHHKIALDTFPIPDSTSVVVLNPDSMTASRFHVPANSKLDMVGDTILVFSGNRVTPYLPDGIPLPAITLATDDTTGAALFASSENKFFLLKSDTVRLFSRSGAYETSFAFSESSTPLLFADNTSLRGNSPPCILSLSTGNVERPNGLPDGGYWVGDKYWYGDGVNTYAVSSPAVTAIRENKPTSPVQFSLEQNFPNPFNPSTMIEYTISGAESQGPGVSVKLAVYDLLGREIALLVNGHQAPGRHRVSWNARGKASGVYFYQLSSGGSVGTREMILMK